MSGIYGYSLAASSQTDEGAILGGLEYWNRIYGRAASGQRQLNLAGIGCHVEHFSEQFPHAEPVIEKDGRYAVVDALLYNRDELLSGLKMDAISTISDEELLLKWIDEKGWHALAQVNGDFAGAIYDPKAGEWTLFRDHLGLRPLYLYLDSGFFAFSTDIRGLLALPQVDASPNEMRLYKNFLLQFSISLLETEFANIHFARPAAITRIRAGRSGFQLTDRIYWKLRSKRVRLDSDEAYQQELRRLITDSVQRRLNAFTGLIGAELSGGLDSSVIDILINRMGREGCYVSWSIDPVTLPLRDGEDERHIINDICRQEDIECLYLRKEDKIDLPVMMERAIPQNFDTPTLGWGSKLLRERGARVVFTGHGGDEGVSHRCNRLEPLVYGEFMDFYKLYLNDLKGVRFRYLKVFKSIIQDLRRLWKKIYAPATEEDLNDPIFNRDFRERMKACYQNKLLTFSFDPVRYVMEGATQHRVDNAAFQGAYCDVRYVYPYLDHRVLDYALSIPRVQYLGKQNRRIFREAFRDILPDSLYHLGYKDFASTRGFKRRHDYRENFRWELDWVLGKLDHEYWGKYLDLEFAATLEPADEYRTLADFRAAKVIENLERLLLIQNIQEKARKWREFDEQGLLL